jgi:hypothetical protein
MHVFTKYGTPKPQNVEIQIVNIKFVNITNGAPRVKIKTKIKERVTPHPLQYLFCWCSGSLKISLKLISQPVFIKFVIFCIFSLHLIFVGCLKIKTCKILQKMLCSEIQPLPRPLQANSAPTHPLFPWSLIALP